MSDDSGGIFVITTNKPPPDGSTLTLVGKISNVALIMSIPIGPVVIKEISRI
ncbi:MAG: hypothetical protein WC091_02185 [Sulfuricellaceae bacterium]